MAVLEDSFMAVLEESKVVLEDSCKNFMAEGLQEQGLEEKEEDIAEHLWPGSNMIDSGYEIALADLPLTYPSFFKSSISYKT